MTRRIIRWCGLATGPGLLALSGCAAGPDYRAPQPAALGVPPAWSVVSDPSARSDPAGNARWWDRFGDAELSRLELAGLAANLDIAQALSRLRQSRELLVQARSAAVPTVSASGGYTHTQSIVAPAGANASGDSLTLGVDAAYQVDLFGGRSRAIEAARADRDASRFGYGAVALTVQSGIAQGYLQVRLQQTNLANAQAAQTNQADNLQIAGWRRQAGLIGDLDVELARSQLAQTTAAIPQIDSSLNQAITGLGVLLGREPGALRAELAVLQPIPTGPASLALGIPVDVLRQRPDVRAAERTLGAATARIGVAQAALYPALSLGGTIGTGPGTFPNPFAVITGQAFASLAQTIFDGGRLRSVVRAQRAATEGAFASYKQTVLTALEDTENAVVALRSANLRQTQFDLAQQSATNSAVLARQQYRSGLIDYASLLITENLLISARNGVAQARHDRAAALVQLFAALGGGWTDQDAVSGQDN
ncbi:efflux transporter outer membrane subunit [Novosphingobium sp.]|uniref:efflux transporter outer membrane subunit n=1 Tax=Novosphingobium sp. TaxID=1874826 RepID=UPI00333E285C